MPTSAQATPRNHSLDGLRGIAVLLVILYHLNLLGIGWVGVQLFFVLSGFLITRLLLGLRDQPSLMVSLRTFYGRRALRIFPLYYLYLLLLLALLWALPQSQRAAVSSQWLYAASYSYNWLGMTELHEKTWLLDHFWSLAVEEQFYLFWPLLILKLPARWLPRVLLAFALAGPLLRAAVWLLWPLSGWADRAALPYAVAVCTLSQLDAFALGGLLCFAGTQLSTWRWPRFWLTALLLLAVCAGAEVNGFGLSPQVGQRAWLTLGYPNTLPLQGQWLWGYSLVNLVSALVLGLALYRGLGQRLLQQPWLVAMGRLSYAAYLLHFPLAHLTAGPAIASLQALTGWPAAWCLWLYLPLYLSLLMGLCLLAYAVCERPLLQYKARWFPLAAVRP